VRALRPLAEGELGRIWGIDRGEVSTHTYIVQERRLRSIPEHIELHGWPREQIATDSLLLAACFQRGGSFFGAFEGDVLVGVAVVDSVWLGSAKDRLQLKYLYVDRRVRGCGVGAALFRQAQAVALARGARELYISATPTARTVDFYLSRGARLAEPPDAALYSLEPDDIHLVCAVSG
jgi:GNAT superfamily N-acetyltransferase